MGVFRTACTIALRVDPSSGYAFASRGANTGSSAIDRVSKAYEATTTKRDMSVSMAPLLIVVLRRALGVTRRYISHVSIKMTGRLIALNLVATARPVSSPVRPTAQRVGFSR